MAEVKFTEQSIEDLEEIASYISTDSPPLCIVTDSEINSANEYS